MNEPKSGDGAVEPVAYGPFAAAKTTSVRLSISYLSSHRTERRKANVLVQDFDRAETDLAQHVELKHQRLRSVFLRDVCKDMIPVFFIFECCQVFAVFLVHQALDRRDRAFDQVENPEQAAGPQLICGEMQQRHPATPNQSAGDGARPMPE